MKCKLITILMIIVLLIFSLSGCTSTKDNIDIDKENKVKIVTSFYPMYILTSNITKDVENVEVTNLTKPYTGCLHDYSISTSEMKILEDSDIFIINGANMEAFMDKVINQMPNLKIIEASKDIQLLENTCNEKHNENQDTNKEHEPNPHVWLSISKAIEQVENIENMLCEYDPKNKEVYEKNANNYIIELENLKEEMHKDLDNIKNKNIITFHESFPYFAEEFNLNIVGVIEREPGSQPSAKELKEIIELIKSLDVRAIFTEPQYPAKIAQIIKSETGVNVYTLDPIVTGEMELDSYTNIMKENLKTLKEALSDGK